MFVLLNEILQFKQKEFACKLMLLFTCMVVLQPQVSLILFSLYTITITVISTGVDKISITISENKDMHLLLCSKSLL